MDPYISLTFPLSLISITDTQQDAFLKENNRPLGRLKHRCKDNIKIDHLVQDRIQWQAAVNTVMNCRVP
jgi:hypothetical protein